MGALDSINACEAEIERILMNLEQKENLGEALVGYRGVETKMLELGVKSGDANFREYQRVMAYCLMRQANLLRQMGRLEEAKGTSEREISAARSSGDEITLARSLMSQGATRMATGDISHGLQMADEARTLFEKGESYDHKQGLGWYWILKADLLNAGLLGKEPPKAIEAANEALSVLEPIKNWPGVARAYAARAVAHEALGNMQAASSDRESKAKHEKMSPSNEDP